MKSRLDHIAEALALQEVEHPLGINFPVVFGRINTTAFHVVESDCNNYDVPNSNNHKRPVHRRKKYDGCSLW